MSITKKVTNGGYKYPDYAPPTPPVQTGDHKVAVDATDEAENGAGYLQEQSAAGAGIAQSVIVDGGERKLETRSLGLTVAVNGDNPDVLYQTVRGKYPIRTNVQGDAPARYVEISVDPTQPPPDPATYAGDLYTAVFEDPLDHGTVKCILVHGESVSLGEDASAEYGPGSWRRTDLSGYWGQPATEVGTPITLYQGDRILVWTPVPYGDDAVRFWIYEVLDPGYHEGAPSTYGVIRRAADANSSATVKTGAFVRILEGENAGKYAVVTNTGDITLDTTAIEITMLDDRTSEFTYPLVTSKQLAGSYEGEATATALPTAADPAYFDILGPRYEMLYGTPMPTEVDAGDWEIQIACKVSSLVDAASENAPADTWIRSVFGIVDMSGPPTYTPLFTVDSEPIKAVDGEAVISVPILDQAGFSLGPNQYFYWTPQARTTAVGTIAVTILVASPQHLTRIRTPLTFEATGGTNRHPDLLDRDLADQHPTLAISPAPQEFVTITAGVMPVVSYGSWANVTSASANLDAMDADDFPDYGEREVYFTVGCKLRSDQATTGTNRPIRTYKGTASVYQEFTARAGATVRFRYRPDLGTAGMWLVTGVQQG